jgi:hypothetical protein
MARKWTNLRGLYARSAERADDEQLRRLIHGLEAEPDQGNSHIAQALAAFREEAQRRGLELRSA